VGWEIYEKLIYGYTYKQWQREPKELPAFIIKRLPIRFTYDTNYFNDKYQGIPIGGYTELFKNILKDIDVKLNVDFFKERSELIKLANKIVYTGKIDEYYSYISGELEYRTLNFENILLEVENYQGNAVINYTDKQIPYTRIIEHKHFEFTKSKIQL
jgi:UDP-galactopyranose mutase